MKHLVILSAIAAGSLFISKANAQVSIHLGINIPAHRVYVPAPPPPVVEEQSVYDDNDNANVSDDDDYYYLPEVEAYYSVGAGCYYYNDGSRWLSCAYLPGAYRDYNWRTAVRYEVRAPRPYLRHDFYRQRWGGYMGDHNNWGHRFDRRSVNGYAYRQGRDDRGNWGRRPNPYDNRGSWGNGRDNHNWGNGNHDNRGGWGNGQQPNHGNHENHGGWGNGNQPNNGNHNNQGGWGNGHQPGNGQPNNGGHDNRGNRGNGQPSNGGRHDRGNGGERFTQNGNSGRGMRRF
jgi:hypothetical protein